MDCIRTLYSKTETGTVVKMQDQCLLLIILQNYYASSDKFTMVRRSSSITQKLHYSKLVSASQLEIEPVTF